jgi:predicted XRE-type DNA-binding protein
MAHKVEDKLEITKSSGNVFADIGLKNSDKYLAKAELARQINHIIEKRALKQQASRYAHEKFWGSIQSTVSTLN